MREQLARSYLRPLFWDRQEAGERLAERLETYRGTDALVLGIPRGGVPVAAEVAQRIEAELDIVVARKVGAPGAPELALGAVTANGGLFLNEDVLSSFQLDGTYLNTVVANEQAEARRREGQLRGLRPRAPIEGRVVIVVDDGMATGATMRAAVRSARKALPARIIVAVPVGSRESCEEMRGDADELVCLHQPEPFIAVGLYYGRFDPTEDAEVRQLLREAYARRPEPEKQAR